MILAACTESAPRGGVVGGRKGEMASSAVWGREPCDDDMGLLTVWHFEQCLLDRCATSAALPSTDGRVVVCKLPVRVAALYGDRMVGRGLL